MRSATVTHPGRDNYYDLPTTRRDVWAGAGGLILLMLGCNIVPAAVVALQYARPGALFGGLEVPFWTPPAVAWAAVGFAMHTMMGIAAWLIVKQRDVSILGHWAIGPFEMQLALGGLAAVALFGLHVPVAALALLGVQALALTDAMLRKFILSRPAVWLLLPCLLAVMAMTAWVGVVTDMNPGAMP
jgi:translocator protein